MRADLHMHTTDSDGKLSPEELFDLAKEKGLDVIAITDHDVCKNVEEKKALAKARGITYIPGIELSTLHNHKSVHVLGYFKDDNHQAPAMKAYYKNIKKGREERAKTFVKNLKTYHNIEISYARIMTISSGIIARPHIARAIQEKYPQYSHDDIFEHFIGDDCKAYVPSTELSTQDGIDLLKAHHALVILAHPKLLKKTIHDTVLNYPFDGIEAIYGLNTEKETLFYKKQAKKRNWLITAGSDYHGINNDTSHKMLGAVSLEGDDLATFLAHLKNDNA